MGWNTTVFCQCFAVRYCFFSAKVCRRKARTALTSLSHCYLSEILLFELSKVLCLLRRIPVPGPCLRDFYFGFPSLLWLLPFDCYLQRLSCSQFFLNCTPSLLNVFFLRQSFPPVMGCLWKVLNICKMSPPLTSTHIILEEGSILIKVCRLHMLGR